MKRAFSVKRLAKTPDEWGGYTEALTATDTLYGVFGYWGESDVVVVDADDDLQPEDVISLAGAEYRCVREQRAPGRRHKMMSVERVTHPLRPTT